MWRRWVLTAWLVATGCVTRNPCEGVVCGNEGLCAVGHDGGPSCLCPAGFESVGARCEVSCTPNPCVEPHRSACAVIEAQVTCGCDRGFVLSGEVCVESAGWDCAQRHDASGEDDGEPDECPEFAKPLSNLQSVQRSILAAGDQDWFSIDVEIDRIHEFQIRETALPLLVEAFDQNLAPVASKVIAPPSGAIAFTAPADARYFFRVRAQTAGLTGDYAVTFERRWFDDFPNTKDRAPALALPTFVGVLDYESDLDVVWVTAPAASKYRFEPSPGAELEFFPGTQQPVVIRDEPVTLIVPAGQRVYLTARSVEGGLGGPFSFPMISLGPDDHADIPQHATVAGLNGLMRGVLERSSDIDTFAIDVVSGQLYRAFMVGTGVRLTLSEPVVSTIDSDVVWLAPRTGRVFVSVTAETPVSSARDYTLTFSELGHDDDGDELASASTYVSPETSGRLELEADTDVFAFEGSVGHVLQVTSTPADLILTIYDAQGSEVASAAGGIWLVGSGSMFARVSRGPTSRGLVPYSFRVVTYPSDDHGDDPATATPIISGDLISAGLQYPSDRDVFFVESTEERIYSLEWTGGLGALPQLIGADGGGINPQPLNTNGRFNSGPGRTTIYLGPGSPGPYTLRITDLGPDDHGSTPQTATPLVPGVVQTGVVSHLGDRDCFWFDALAGRFYVVSRIGTYAQLRDISWRALPAFPLPVDTRVFPCVDSQVFDTQFTISVTDLGPDDHGDFAASATPAPTLSGNGVVQGENDFDSFSMTVTPFHFYSLDSTNNVSAVPWQANAALARTFKAEGTELYVRVGYATQVPASFTWSLIDLGPDDHEDNPQFATALTPGLAATGVITASIDRDAFSLDLPAGSPVTVTLTGAPAMLTVRSPSGVSSGSPNFTTNEAGRWSFIVSAANATTYSLRVDAPGLDEFPNTPMSAIELVPGAPLISGGFQYAGDLDYFFIEGIGDHHYELQVEGAYLSLTDPSGFNVMPMRVNGRFDGPSRFSWGSGRLTVLISRALTATYTMRLIDLGPDDHGKNPQTATSIVPGTPVYGVLTFPLESDYFRFDAIGGHTYELTFSNLIINSINVGIDVQGGIERSAPLRFVAAADGPVVAKVYNHVGPFDQTYRFLVEDLGIQ